MVLVVGAILIATDVIDTGDTTTWCARPDLQPAANPAADDGRQTVQDIYSRRAAAWCSSSPRA